MSEAASAEGARSEPKASGVIQLSGAAQPLLLAIETATRVMSVALLDGERVIAEISSDDARVHSERLLPALDRLLELAGTKLDAVGAFAISIGPGSFTGLRIGLATLKAFAFDETRPVAAVPTLAALCAAAAGAPGRSPRCSTRDAAKLYAAAVAAAGDPEPTLLPDSVFTPEELAARAAAGGDTRDRRRRRGRRRAPSGAAPDLRPLAAGEGAARAARIGRLGRALLAAGRAVPAAALVPRYVRRAEAEARRLGLPTEPAGA